MNMPGSVELTLVEILERELVKAALTGDRTQASYTYEALEWIRVAAKE